MAKPWLQPIGPKRRVMPKVSVAEIGGVLVKFAVAVIDRQTRYPPQRAGARYRRTGTYGSRWTMKGPMVKGMGLVIQAGSNLEYAPKVGGMKTGKYRQAPHMAKAGWTSVEEVGEDEWKRIKPAVIKALH